MKLTPDEQKELIPDDSIKAAFLARDDIKLLTSKEQEKRWIVALENINKFRDQLSKHDCYVV